MTTEESGKPGKHSEHVEHGKHSKRGGIWFDVRDAITLRAFLLVVATLGLGIAFIVSYVGALHSPRLQNLPITIVSDNPQVTAQLISRLESSVPHGTIVPSAGTSAAAATEQVKNRKTAAAFIYDVSGKQDTLIVASSAAAAQARAVQTLFASVEQQEGRTLKINDAVPAAAQDANGLASFYLVVGWCVTGYLIAAILGVSAGSRPATTTRAVVRLTALALSGFAAAAVGTWIAGPHILDALSGAFWPMVLTGTLLVLGVAAITMAMQVAFGVIGIGIAVLLVVVLGNPSAGGAIPRSMLPTFWRAIGAFLPPGAGTDSVRSITYFGGDQTGYPLLIMAAYTLLGITLSLLLCTLKSPPARPSTTPVAATQ